MIGDKPRRDGRTGRGGPPLRENIPKREENTLTRTLDRLINVLEKVGRTLDTIAISTDRFTRHSRISQVPKTVPAGQRQEIFKYQHKPGLIDHLYIKVDRKDATIILKIDSEEISKTPSDLADQYYSTYNPRTMFLTEYDETADSYQILYTPLPPRQYEDHYELVIVSPAASATQVEVDEVHFEEILR